MKTFVIPGYLYDVFSSQEPAVQIAKALEGMGGIDVYSAIAIKVDDPKDEMMVELALSLSKAKFEVINYSEQEGGNG